MSRRELGRVEVLARVRSRQLKLVDATALLGVSYRQTKRLWKRYQQEGAAGLKHRSAGRRSNRACAVEFRRQVLGLVREKYGGAVGERFGPTLAAEHLASEDGLHLDAETLRRWMLAEGLWSRERRRRPHRRRRERKEHFGEMVQLDGSFHRWLEDRGPEGCLMDLVDDATNQTLARLGEQETIWAVVDVLRRWIELRGVPLALYVDWKNLYKRCATPAEQLRGEEPITQFGRMCARLGIELINAHSPQAKGRVERMHGTHQDRLVKKLRRKQMSGREQVNVYLEREYLPEHNQRFARVAAKPEDYHRRAPGAAELDRIFRLETERTISDDWVVRYHNRYFQVQAQSRNYAPARSKVLVCEGRHGKIGVEYRGRELSWKEIAAPMRPAAAALPGGKLRATHPERTEPPVVARKWVPPADHPWKRGYDRRVAAAVLSGSGLRSALNGPHTTRPRAALRPEPERTPNIRKNGSAAERGHF